MLFFKEDAEGKNEMKIFVVDDSMMIWAWIKEIAADIDGTDIIGFAGIPDRAIERIEKLCPDLVLLDLKLYGGSGLDVLKEIKEKSPETAVAVFTSYIRPEFKKKCRDLGADYFFDKSKDHEKISKLLSEGIT